MKPDYSDLGAVPVKSSGSGDYSDLGAVRVEKKADPYPMGKNAVEIAQDTVMIPAVALAKGAHKGAAAAAKPLAGVLKFVGTPDDLNLFLKAQIGNERAAANLPDTNPNKSLITSMANAPFELIGEAPGVIVEFEQGAGVAKLLGLGPVLAKTMGLPEANKAVQGVLQSTEFAITKGMEGLKNGVGEALKEGGDAASMSLAFPVVGGIIKEVGGKYGKKAVKGVLSVLTGDEKLAEEIVSNPGKYVLNPFKKVQSPDKALEEGKARIDAFKKNNADEMLVEREILDEQINTLKASQAEAKAALADKASKSLSEIKATSEAALAKAQEASVMSLTAHTDNTIKALTDMRKQKGEAVGKAVTDIIESNPMESVPYKVVGRRFEGTVKEAVKKGEVPFNIGTEAVSAKTVAADAGEVAFFDGLWKEFTSRKQAGELSVSYLQTLKGALSTRAEMMFKAGKNQFGKLYSDLSKVVNPAKLTEKVPGLMEEEGNIVVGMAKKYPGLAKANQEYATFKPQHDELVALVSKKDANGQLVPDITKVVNAVERGDVATMNRIWKAEKGLPTELQILPKAKQAVASKHKLEDEALATYKLAQQKAKAEKAKLAAEQKQILNYQVSARRRQLFDLNKRDQEKADTMFRDLTQKVEFLERQQKARLHWPDFKMTPTGHIKLDPRPAIAPVAVAGARALMAAGGAAKKTAEKVGSAMEGNLLSKIEDINVGPESREVADAVKRRLGNEAGFVGKGKPIPPRDFGYKLSKKEIKKEGEKMKDLGKK